MNTIKAVSVEKGTGNRFLVRFANGKTADIVVADNQAVTISEGGEVLIKEDAPVTGRPFMAGVNEPEKGQWVYYLYQETGRVAMSRWAECRPAHTEMLVRLLSRGEIYPTHDDCLEGNKRDEICKRYEAMGRKFEEGNDNYSPWYHFQKQAIQITSYSEACDIGPHFDTEEDCQAAIDFINAEYGAGAFERYRLGVETCD